MNNIVSVSDFRNNIADYIDRVIYKDESIILKKGGKIVAKVTAYIQEESQEKEYKHPLMNLAGLLSEEVADQIESDIQLLEEEGKKEMKNTLQKFNK